VAAGTRGVRFVEEIDGTRRPALAVAGADLDGRLRSHGCILVPGRGRTKDARRGRSIRFGRRQGAGVASSTGASSAWEMCASCRQMSTTNTADPTNANQNGAVTPHR
jgi:hypothetical protein